MWIIKRPNGNQYVRENLDNLKAAYGADKKGLTSLGWKFSKKKVKLKKEETHEDD